MKKNLPARFALCLLFLAGSAQALQTDELIAISAMPLAVAEVSALPEVPRSDLITVVTTLNHAAVPAPQFIEVVRYAPVALVETTEPRFVTYVTDEFDRGVVGQPLAVAIADRYGMYGVREINVVDPPPMLTIVEQRQILPPVVVTRFQTTTTTEFDPIALVAMPLAVAAVADLAGVPRNDLMDLVATLNNAFVPAPQFVEVVRYSPVMLVDQTQSPQFVQFVRTEFDRGVIGRPLAFAIADRLRTAGVDDIDVVRPQPVIVVDRDEVLLPPVVVTRVARDHPHGGPPGQLKKELGLKTGAEVVHGTTRARTTDRVTEQRRVRPRKVRSERREVQPRVQERRVTAAPRVVKERRVTASPRVVKERGDSGKGHSGKGNSGNSGKGNSGKGKGKGKG